MTRQAVTKHLLLLEAANLVAVVWRGREKLHYLNPVPIHEISERWIGKYERHRLQALSDLKKGLEQNRPKNKQPNKNKPADDPTANDRPASQQHRQPPEPTNRPASQWA